MGADMGADIQPDMARTFRVLFTTISRTKNPSLAKG
jgi:hypothetical protein